MSIEAANMSSVQIEAFLAEARFAIVATNRGDGPPQQSPVWYLHQDGKIYVSVYRGSAKYRNLRRDPRINICVAGTPPDARAVMMSGKVEFHYHDTLANFEEIRWALVRRYYESDAEAEAYFKEEGEPEQSALIVLQPERILAQDHN